MKTRSLLIIVVALNIISQLSAQIKIEPSPYTVATTYEKLKKEYPFIKPITEQKSALLRVKENQVYKKTETSSLKLDVYYPAGSEKKNLSGGFAHSRWGMGVR